MFIETILHALELTKNLTAEKSKSAHFGLYLIIFRHFVRIFLLNF